MNLSVDIEELFEDFELEDFVETISEFLPWHHWVQITLYGIIFIFGLIANIMVILVFLITLKVRLLFLFKFLEILLCSNQVSGVSLYLTIFVTILVPVIIK